MVASIAITNDSLGIVELSQASGITTPHHGLRDPVAADTYGTGILISAAVSAGAREVLVAAGGSATTDGGAGAIAAINNAGGLSEARVTVLCDVTTTFIDAARVFGPQKGADAETVERLTARLEEQAGTFLKDPTNILRSGAAGGFSGAMWAHFDAELVSGADRVLELVGFNTALRDADAVVTGEGRLDSQTGQGKVIESVLCRTRTQDSPVPVVAMVGTVDPGLGDYADNFTEIIVTSDAFSMKAAGQTLVTRLRK